MKEILLSVLYSVVSVAASALSVFAIKYLSSLASEIRVKTGLAIDESLEKKAIEAVETAVNYAFQTYVDELKASGKFDVESQGKALGIALNKTVELMSSEVRTYISGNYGDITNWIVSNIENIIAKSKK